MGEQYAGGRRVSRHRPVADATVGTTVNPMWARDVRRLVASPSAFPGRGRPCLSERPSGPGAGCRESRNGSSDLVSLSLPELRRLIARLTHRRPAASDHILHGRTGDTADNTKPAPAATGDAAPAPEAAHPSRHRLLRY